VLRVGHGVEADAARADALWGAVDWPSLVRLAGGPAAVGGGGHAAATATEAGAASAAGAPDAAAAGPGAVAAGTQVAAGPGGDANAQYLVGAVCESGRPPLPASIAAGGPSPDKAAAVAWYRLAASQGHPRAQHALGVCYYYGDGVGVDKVASVAWDTLAAAQGHVKAQYSLGVCYDNGEGVGQEDEREAAKYYALAAAQVGFTGMEAES
jgi:TPR repeat protein